MMKKRLTRGGFLFATVWLGIFAIAFLIWAIYLGFINERLAEYESIQPKYEAERVFNEYFLNADASDIIGYEEGFYSEYDKADAPEKAISSLIEGKELSYKAESRSLYSVYANGEKIAQFTLKGSEEKTPLLGARRPILDKIDLFAEPLFEVTVIAPKGAVIKVNGKTVSSDDMSKGVPVALAEAEYFPNDEARTMISLRLGKLFAEPTVSVESADGAIKYGIEFFEGSYTYSAEKSYVSYQKNAYYGATN
jgi:hypothetical protein